MTNGNTTFWKHGGDFDIGAIRNRRDSRGPANSTWVSKNDLCL